MARRIRALLPAARTIGVIASGIDVAYPPEHAKLQERIAEEALLLAEQPPGVEPLARHFPSRNRIIAGLAAGTLVVEAAPQSGSLITARLAGEAGREIMAIPGSPLDSRSAGCNQLIRDGAVLVQSPDEVLEAVGPIDARMVREPAPAPVTPPMTARMRTHAGRSAIAGAVVGPARPDAGRGGRNCAPVGASRGGGAARSARTRTCRAHRTPRRSARISAA